MWTQGTRKGPPRREARVPDTWERPKEVNDVFLDELEIFTTLLFSGSGTDCDYQE